MQCWKHLWAAGFYPAPGPWPWCGFSWWDLPGGRGEQPWHPEPSGHTRPAPTPAPIPSRVEISISSPVLRSKQSQLFIEATPEETAPYRRQQPGSVPGSFCRYQRSWGLIPAAPSPQRASAEPEQLRQVCVLEERRVQRHSLLRSAVTPGDAAPHGVTGSNQITAAELRGICLLKIA